MADFSAPDFSVPALADADLERPGLAFPDPARPDPPLPALLAPAIPPELDLQPDEPLLSAHLEPPLPVTDLRLPPSAEPEYAEKLRGPLDVTLAQPAGELASDAREMARESPDARQVPPGLSYARDFTTQETMTHRLRRLALLLAGLDGNV